MQQLHSDRRRTRAAPTLRQYSRNEVWDLKAYYPGSDDVHRRLRNLRHSLDWFVAPKGSTLIDDVAVSENAIPDPKTLTFLLGVSQPQRQKHVVTSRKPHSLHSDRFHSDAKFVCDNALCECAEVDSVEVCNTSMRPVLDNRAPLKTRCVSLRPSAPWTDEDIREAKRALFPAEQLANRWKLRVHREIFVKQRNLLKGLHCKAKREHYCNKPTVLLLSCFME